MHCLNIRTYDCLYMINKTNDWLFDNYKCVKCLSLADMSGVDWMVRHGRSMALAIAVKSAPEKLCQKEYSDTVTEIVLANATADRVRSSCQDISSLPSCCSNLQCVWFLTLLMKIDFFFYLDHQKGYKQWWFTKLIPKICITTPNKTNLFLGRFLIALDILFLMLLYYKNNTTNQDNIDFKY